MKTKLNDSKPFRRNEDDKFDNSFYRALKLLSIVGLFCLSCIANAQTTDSENPVILAAPNLPIMERSAGEGKIFYGEKFTYKAENEGSLKEWIANYPSEVSNYKVAIDEYLKDTDVSKLSVADQNTYYDLKSQWLMATQLIN